MPIHTLNIKQLYQHILTLTNKTHKTQSKHSIKNQYNQPTAHLPVYP